MTENTKGEWIKYEKEPGKWGSKDSSYTRLCDDLRKHQNTGWNLGFFADYIYGELIPCHGTIPSDMYVYYIIDSKSGKRKPKLCLAAHKCDDGKFYVAILGVKRRINKDSKNKTFEPEARYLPVLLEKLQELNAKDWILEDHQTSLTEYQDLEKISKEGVQTHEDILAIYRNLTRVDTMLAWTFAKGRNIQEDYDVLNEEEKIAFVEIICSLDSNTKEKLAKVTNAKGLLLSVKEIDILKATATSTDLLCLWLAPIEYRQNKDTLLEILSDYDIKHFATLGIDAISEELQIDIDILHALARTQPYQLEFILRSYQKKYNENRNKLLEERVKDREYMLALLDMHFRNVISNPSYRKESFIPAEILWNFAPEMLDDIENELLYGPFATIEEEQMKNKARDVIKLERTKIKSFKEEHPEYFS